LENRIKSGKDQGRTELNCCDMSLERKRIELEGEDGSLICMPSLETKIRPVHLDVDAMPGSLHGR
jgi:hypothetical protein